MRCALALAALAACRGERTSEREPAPARAVLPPTPWKPGVIAHCGAGTPPEAGSGCDRAADAAMKILEADGDPLDAAVAGAVVLEDDPRYNAGTGSVVRLDGVTVQMDAAVMDSGGRFGAVAGLEEVKNPIRVARAVADTPNRILVGAGAIAFARAVGQPIYDPRTPERLTDARRLAAELAANDASVAEAWRTFDWRRVWNYDGPTPAAAAATGATAPDGGGDTVGVAVRGKDGRFAAALSTGGWTVVLRGRVGDVPIPGAGLFAGPHGAVAATGRGERIIDAHLARTVYGWLAEGMSASEAVRRGVDLVDGEGALIAITATEVAAEARPPMAWCTR